MPPSWDLIMVKEDIDYSVRNRLKSIQKELLITMNKNYNLKLSKTNASEKKITKLLCSLLRKNDKFIIKSNELLYGFEADIIIISPNGHIVNIEVDGPVHEYISKKRFCERRDAFLDTKGIIVVRIKAVGLDRMSTAEFEKFMTSELLLKM